MSVKSKSLVGVLEQAATGEEIHLKIESAYDGGKDDSEYYEAMTEKWVSVESVKQFQEYWVGELHKLEKAKLSIGVAELASKENVVVPYIDGCISLLREFLGVKKGEDHSVSHRLLRTCCPSQYDKNEESSIYTKKGDDGK